MRVQVLLERGVLCEVLGCGLDTSINALCAGFAELVITLRAGDDDVLARGAELAAQLLPRGLLEFGEKRLGFFLRLIDRGVEPTHGIPPASPCLCAGVSERAG